MIVHTLFDLLAAALAMAMTLAVYRWRLSGAMARLEHGGWGYAVALLAGGGLPFLVGYVIWRLAISAGRRRIQ